MTALKYIWRANATDWSVLDGQARGTPDYNTGPVSIRNQPSALLEEKPRLRSDAIAVYDRGNFANRPIITVERECSSFIAAARFADMYPQTFPRTGKLRRVEIIDDATTTYELTTCVAKAPVIVSMIGLCVTIEYAFTGGLWITGTTGD